MDYGPGGHDDVINAAAGALVLAARPVCTILEDVHLCGLGDPTPAAELPPESESWHPLDSRRFRSTPGVRPPGGFWQPI